jgi:hypothetical protein
MHPREMELALELCREVDLLVALGPGASNMGVLERERDKMNDFVRRNDLEAAVDVALRISMLHGGIDPDKYDFLSGPR